MWGQSTTPLENPQHWIIAHGCAAAAPGSCWLQNSCRKMIQELLGSRYCSHCIALATGHHQQGTAADGGLQIRFAGSAPGVFLPWLSWGWKLHCHFLELFIWGPKWAYERVHRHLHWATNWRKQMENGMSGSSLLAVAVVNCWSSTCLPLPLSFQLVSFTLFRSLFLILSPSLSPSLGIFFQAVYVYFLFPSQCLPTPMAVFFLL